MQRLERRHRLTQKTEFDRVLGGRGQSTRAGPFRLVMVQSPTPSARLGIVVPKRHVKQAVHRNKIKRVIRESFRLTLKDLPPLDVVVLLTRPPGDDDPRCCLDQAWSKLRAEHAGRT